MRTSAPTIFIQLERAKPRRIIFSFGVCDFATSDFGRRYTHTQSKKTHAHTPRAHDVLTMVLCGHAGYSVTPWLPEQWLRKNFFEFWCCQDTVPMCAAPFPYIAVIPAPTSIASTSAPCRFLTQRAPPQNDAARGARQHSGMVGSNWVVGKLEM